MKTIPGSTTTLIYSPCEIEGTPVIFDQVDLDTGTSHVFPVSEELASYIGADQLTGTLTIIAVTFVNGLEAGRVSTAVTLTLPDDRSPTLTLAIEPVWPDDSSETTSFSAYIQNQSGVSFTFTTECKYYANLVSYSLFIEGVSYNRTLGTFDEKTPLIHLPFSVSGEVPWSASITDSRGATTTQTGTISVIPWSPPAINRFDVYRVTETNAEAIDGTYIRASADLSCSSLIIGEEQKNSLRFHILYRKIADTPGEWVATDEVPITALQTVMTLLLKKDGLPVGGGGVDADGNNLPFNEMLGYEFQLVANDLYGESTAQTAIPSAQQFQDIDENTGNMGFGGNAPEATEDSAYRFYKQTDFPAGIQVEQQRYGWHAGDAIEFTGGMAIAGYLTGGSKDCHALLFLGQPIFAAGAGLSGSAVLRGIKGYLDNMSYETGVPAGTSGYTFTAQIMNAKAGIVQLSISKTSAFTNSTNNTPIVINGAGNESLVLTFV